MKAQLIYFNFFQSVYGSSAHYNLEEDYINFVDLCRKKNLSKDCHSTINKPLFTEEKDTEILDKYIIPELHVLQGFVNHLFWDGLVPLVGREKTLLWPTKLKLISKEYHGEIFEGNACGRLLKEADKLDDKEIYKDISIFALTPYITAFKIMDKIVMLLVKKTRTNWEYKKINYRITQSIIGHKSIRDSKNSHSSTAFLSVLRTNRFKIRFRALVPTSKWIGSSRVS